MKLAVVVCALVAFAALASAHSAEGPKWRLFNEWKVRFGIEYESHVENMNRFKIFCYNMAIVEAHNAEYEKGVHTFTLGLNHFAAMTNDEFSAKYLGYKRQVAGDARELSEVEVDVAALPKSVNWTADGLVTLVKNQGECGSCWSFSATGSLEGQHAKKTQNLVVLSEQQLVDCDGRDHGCHGGNMDTAAKYLIKHGGCVSEEDYPYKSGETGKSYPCQDQGLPIAALVDGYKYVKRGSESDLQANVANVGPISVAIDATGLKFQLYKGGVYYRTLCSSERLDHGVLAAGYGTENGQDYWLVKNSWSTEWGEYGYIRMSRNKGNNCGIATDAGYVYVKGA